MKGPDFLWYDEATWPQRPTAMSEDQQKDGDLEVNRALFLSMASTTAARSDVRMVLQLAPAEEILRMDSEIKNGARNAATGQKQEGVSQPQGEEKIRSLDVEDLRGCPRKNG